MAYTGPMGAYSNGDDPGPEGIIAAQNAGLTVGTVAGSPGMAVENPWGTGPGYMVPRQGTPQVQTPQGVPQQAPAPNNPIFPASNGQVTGQGMGTMPPAGMGGSGGSPMPIAPPGAGAGWVNGVMMAQQNARANDSQSNQDQQQANQNQQSANANEAFGWQRSMVARQQAIMQGMSQAAQAGGYTGVIDFLKVADPDRAMAFENAKDNLDQNIMKTDVMKNITIPQAKQEAMFQAYGHLGSMGFALLHAPPGQQQAMYDQMQPMVKAVMGPNAPSNVQDFAPIALLGVAQAAGVNQLMQAQKTASNMSSKTGQAIDDYTKASNYYGTDSPQASAALQNVQQMQQTQGFNNDKASFLAAQQGPQEVQKLNQQLQDSQKSFNAVNTAHSNLGHVLINPGQAQAPGNDANLAINYITTMIGKVPRVNPQTGELLDSESMPEQALKTYDQATIGGGFTPDVRQSLLEQENQMYNSQKANMDAQTSRYKANAVMRGLPVDQIVSPIATTPQGQYTTEQLTNMKDIQTQVINNNQKASPQAKAAALQQLNTQYQQHIKAANVNIDPTDAAMINNVTAASGNQGRQ
ncbi:hypothetical protein UFOVP1_46 [uncultured Caudovirales phage]|uniref:Uncharacterized protein n=1 Tax=uncultured Caudovirales phage TaxID=2100421 RepID=A0A6J5KHS3_9CAUD|nr:hypothetical protein UFOVP1_46 [uncultured Caudovirales phage]